MDVHERLDLVELLMLRMWGLPYRWGGDDAIEGFDCSGGVLEILKSVGLWAAKGDASSQELHDYFSRPEHGEVLLLENEPTMGTLVFYGASVKEITHVAMALNSEVKFEFGGGDHTTVSNEVASRQNAYGRFRPISARQDLVAFVRPALLRSSP